MKVNEFAFVGHPVESMIRARKFYEEVLNFPQPNVLRGELESDSGFFEYEIGPHTLAITTDWSDGEPPSQLGFGLVLEVEDFDEAIAHIKYMNVDFELGPAEGDTCSIAVISDPDGNKIGIHKRKCRQP